jgi:dephospho-CoA kinase
MSRHIIGLVGRQGSGKGTAAKILAEKYGAQLFRFSAILGDVLDRVAVERTRDNMIDGIRRIEDIAALEPLPQFKLVEISAPAKVRYDRMTHRGEKSGENEMTWDEFAEQEQAPTELSIPSVAARAWKAIDNDGSAEELTVKIDAMMQELG